MIKSYFTLAVAVGCGLAHAELKLPKGLYTTETIEDAKTTALDKEKPVAFLVSQRSLSPS